MKTIPVLVCATVAALISTASVRATPYASGVTVSGTTVNWHLNETVNSGVVAYLFNVSGNSYAQSNYVGGSSVSPVVAGPQTFSLGLYTNFQIYIYSAGTGVPHQISPNPGTTSPSSPLVDFYGPRGVGVNRNPNSPHFGTVYVVCASAGTDSVRTTGRGGYALNADFTDAFAYGGNAKPPVGTGTGQIQYGSSATYGPWRVFVGPDDAVYIGDSSGLGTGAGSVGGGVWMVAPDLSIATNLFPFNGTTGATQLVCCESTPNVTGSYPAGNMTLHATEGNRLATPGGYQAVWQYQFFSGATPITLPWDLTVIPNDFTSSGCGASIYGYTGNGNPNTIVSGGIGTTDGVSSDLYIAPDGKFFCSENRSGATATYSKTLWVYDKPDNGSCLLWDSMDANGGSVDAFATCIGMAVSPDDQFLALGESNVAPVGGNASNVGKILVAVLDGQMAATGVVVNGLPDLGQITRIAYGAGADLIRGVAWDAADNVYGVSGSDDSLRCYTLGLTNTAITGNDTTGTNGTFVLITPPRISVMADEAIISQPNTYGNPTSGTFTLTRAGDLSGAVTVPFTLGGAATNGSTYTISPASSVTFLAGSPTAQVTVAVNPAIAEAVTLTVVLNIAPGAGYLLGGPTNATMSILNTGPQELAITGVAVSNMYRGISNDFASFVITRYGDTNAGSYTIPANSFNYSGTATVGVDYAAISQPVTISSGAQTVTVQVGNPVTTGIYHGNESITVALNGNTGVPTLPGSATMTLVDNADPPAPVVWSDPLTNAADSVNWTLTFANSNLGPTTVLPVLIPNYPNYSLSSPDPNPVDDFDVEFGYSITNDGVGASPAMLLNGWTNALKMTVNKFSSYDGLSHGCSAGVNVYPTGSNFSGNYAFRFSMNLAEGAASTTEYNLFGINHNGTNCNWFASDLSATNGSLTTNSDGIWYWIDADNNGNGSFSYVQVFGPPLPNKGWNLYTNILATAAPYTSYFKAPVPFNCTRAGVPADGDGQPANTWADVEVKQVNGKVTMSINKFPIIVYNNVTNAKSGDIMLGYDDPYASIGQLATAFTAPGAAVYYSNARVVQLTPPRVTSASYASTAVTINFTDSDTDDTAASFQLMASSTVNGTYSPVTAAFSQLPSGAWQALVTVPNGTVAQFYQVVRLN